MDKGKTFFGNRLLCVWDCNGATYPSLRLAAARTATPTPRRATVEPVSGTFAVVIAKVKLPYPNEAPPIPL